MKCQLCGKHIGKRDKFIRYAAGDRHLCIECCLEIHGQDGKFPFSFSNKRHMTEDELLADGFRLMNLSEEDD